MPSIDDTLAERGSRYGDFIEHATITQAIKNAMAEGENWGNMDDDQQECLEMIAHKIGRILNGDPNYIDSWTDIIGYTRLVEKRLLDTQAQLKAAENRESIPKKTVPEEIRAYAAKFKDDQSKADKEIADKVRSLSPGVHMLFVDEESGEI